MPPGSACCYCSHNLTSTYGSSAGCFQKNSICLRETISAVYFERCPPGFAHHTKVLPHSAETGQTDSASAAGARLELVFRGCVADIRVLRGWNVNRARLSSAKLQCKNAALAPWSRAYAQINRYLHVSPSFVLQYSNSMRTIVCLEVIVALDIGPVYLHSTSR